MSIEHVLKNHLNRQIEVDDLINSLESLLKNLTNKKPPSKYYRRNNKQQIDDPCPHSNNNPSYKLGYWEKHTPL